MFLFFRKLRIKLIDEGRLGRYVLYGLGEIFLVVVGILIALQIDNWNENRKEQQLAIQYLEGIHSDLSKDVVLINQIIKDEVRAVAVITSIDNVLEGLYIAEPELFTELWQPHNEQDMMHLYRRGTSFRAIRANYTSLVSDGKSGLISNRELFGELQLIYDEQHTRLNSIYDSIKMLEGRVISEYAYEKYNWDYAQLVEAKDQKIFYELANFTELKFLYCQWLILLRRDIETMLVKLEQEIDSITQT